MTVNERGFMAVCGHLQAIVLFRDTIETWEIITPMFQKGTLKPVLSLSGTT